MGRGTLQVWTKNYTHVSMSRKWPGLVHTQAPVERARTLILRRLHFPSTRFSLQSLTSAFGIDYSFPGEGILFVRSAYFTVRIHFQGSVEGIASGLGNMFEVVVPYIPIFIKFILDEAQNDAMRFKSVSFGNQAMGPSGSDVYRCSDLSSLCWVPSARDLLWDGAGEVMVSRPAVMVPGPVRPVRRQVSSGWERNLTPWARSQGTSLLAPAIQHSLGV